MNTNFQTFHQMGGAISDFVKQATGRDNVQNIDMEHITVAQNHYYEDVDVSGHAVVFTAGAEGIPFEKCVVQIEPVQDLHGYDHPWPAGGGKNVIDTRNIDYTIAGVRITSDSDGIISLTGTRDASTGWKSFITFSLAPGNYFFSTNNPHVICLLNYTQKTGDFTVSEGDAVRLALYNTSSGDVLNETGIKCQIEKGDSATAWTPYSNICPITGWTMVNVYQAGQSLEDVRTFRFTFPSEAGIVYGGYADLVAGKLVVDRAEVDLSTLQWSTGFGGFMSRGLDNVIEPATGYDSGTRLMCSAYRSRAYVSRIDKCITRIYGGVGYYYNGVLLVKDSSYTSINDFVSAVSGVQLVYYLATPVEYSLSSPEAITTLKGINHIWADTGDIEVKFTDLKELY